jgi:hypothetical protein
MRNFFLRVDIDTIVGSMRARTHEAHGGVPEKRQTFKVGGGLLVLGDKHARARRRGAAKKDTHSKCTVCA